ncbi:collagen alpha-1(XII) chain-like [Styela clava]
MVGVSTSRAGFVWILVCSICIRDFCCAESRTNAKQTFNDKTFRNNAENLVPGRVKREEFCEEDLDSPDNLQVREVGDTRVVIDWKKVKGAQWYVLELQPYSECVANLEKPKTNQATINKLDSSTEYVLTVAAYGKSGDACSTKSELKFKTADGDVKCEDYVELGAIKNLRAPEENMTTTSVLLQWKPSENALSYIVDLKPLNLGRGGLGEMNATSVTLRGLASGQNYTASVTPKRKKNLGETKTLIFVPKIKSPNQFRISNLSSQYFRAEWEQNESVLKYTLSLFKLDKDEKEEFVEKKETAENYVYFRNLIPVTQYRVDIQGSNGHALSMTKSVVIYTKLPTPRNVTKWNVTYSSVHAAWEPVDGATIYRVVIRQRSGDGERKVTQVNETKVFIKDLVDATEYVLEIFAKNQYAFSLPGSTDVYTKLTAVQLLNVDPDYIEDTSLVIRWDKVGPANWYAVSIQPNTPGAKGIGDVKPEFTRITNLKPGIMYTITVVAMNTREFPTASEPNSIQQATQLPRPDYLTASYEDVKHNQIRLTWNPIPMTNIYFLFAYDCSKRGSKIDPKAPRSTMGPTTQPQEYMSKMKYWNYQTLFKKRAKTKLTCESIFADVQQAIREAKMSVPSNVEGQGQINGTEAVLSNLYPNTKYEFVLVAGDTVKQSEAKLYRRYTKLPDPENFIYDKSMVMSSSVEVRWNKVEEATYYTLKTTKTDAVRPENKFKPRARRITVHVETTKLKAKQTDSFVRNLLPSTNYTFALTG